jgi:hypothetical protein
VTFSTYVPGDSALVKDPAVSRITLAVTVARRNDTLCSSVLVEIHVSAKFDKPLEPHSVTHTLWRQERMVKNEYLSYWARGEHTNKKFASWYSSKLRVQKWLVKLLPISSQISLKIHEFNTLNWIIFIILKTSSSTVSRAIGIFSQLVRDNKWYSGY